MIFGGRGGANVGSRRRTCRWIFYRRCRRRRLLGHIMMATVLGFRAQSMFSCRVRPTTTSTLPDRYRARPGVGALWHPVLSTADLRVEHLVTSPSLIIVDVFIAAVHCRRPNTGCFRRLEHLPSHVILFAFSFVRCPCSRSDIMPP